MTNPQSGKLVKEWTSHPGGVFDPHALNITFDVPVTLGGSPVHQPTIIVEGVSLQDITNAQQYSGTVQNGQIVGGTNLVLRGGMQAGLPLANPDQAGLLVQGTVFQSWGNWIGTDMALTLLIVPTIYRYNAPGNIVFTWNVGQTLQAALQQTLGIAFPNTKVTYRLSDSLV
ncbi:MAG: hypothetical protein KGL35_12080, partial [Bradyrhizobium sp.]|nr:hypothetical protein [Bradyrhizobium sp.]